ncbi:MAG: histidine kinase [Rhodospirillaceae bacterium]|nr:histidine kinase [Rhodospirillaceae bacterium]
MMAGWVVVLASLAYLSLLFAIAYYGDRRADQGRSLIRHPAFYALSIAVYCTSWTFYGSVGRAAENGPDFLPIYLGPTLVFLLGWVVLRKMIRISKANRITTIADFIAARYGKSQLLAGLVTIIAVVGILPYISLQLKAVSQSFSVLIAYPEIVRPSLAGDTFLLLDEALWVAILMATFAILFGTRHIDAAEHHQGMVAAIAFESIVKLVAFLAVGAFVTFGIYNGFGDIFDRIADDPAFAKSFTFAGAEGISSWLMIGFLAMGVVICLPRQFQVIVVENLNERDVKTAIWLFPAYLIAINIFVLPIAMAGLLHFGHGTVAPDTFVLALPMAEKQPWLALLVFLGGLSAATGMVIVETIALSTMVCNDLVMPVLLRTRWYKRDRRRDLTRALLGIRRGAIILILVLGYFYFRFIGESYALVTIGLVSFVAAAQFAPVLVGGMVWKGGTRAGAFAGLLSGFAVWTYTLLLPSLARSGWMPLDFVEHGPFGIALLKPYGLFGLTGFDSIGHATFWSLLVNVGVYVTVSLSTRQDAIERIQAAQFVDVFRQGGAHETVFWRGTATLSELRDLVARFVGQERADQAFRDYARARGIDLAGAREADADLISFAERVLAGAIGAASARVMVGSVAKGEMVGIEEVMRILDEASQILQYSRQLELKSQQLEAATRELREANLRLQELDRLKDDFLSTVSHELRTPLTSIRSFSEILLDNPGLDPAERGKFIAIIAREAERLTRLINQLLDLAKLEAGRLEWQMSDFDPGPVVQEAVASVQGLVVENGIKLETELPESLPFVRADKDRLTQVVINLLSNAVKFADPKAGHIWVSARAGSDFLEVSVRDNGQGVPPEWQERIFERFTQLRKRDDPKPQGTGLGLPICRQIIEFFGGRIWVASRAGHGATFTFTVPLSRAVTRKLVAA